MAGWQESMGRTLVYGTINGARASKEYSFLVDTGAIYIGLPFEEIQALGLTPIPDGKRRFVTATGPVELDTYTALGRIRGRGFSATVVPTPIPLIGYEILESMRFRVNLVTQQLEEVPEDELFPSYLLSIVEDSEGNQLGSSS